MDELYQYERARKRVKKKKAFYMNLISWLSCSFFLFAVNLFTSPVFIWAFFPFIGWGIAVFFQGLSAFSAPGFGREWEEKEMHREMKKLESRNRIDGDEEYLELDDLKELRPKYKDSDFV